MHTRVLILSVTVLGYALSSGCAREKPPASVAPATALMPATKPVTAQRAAFYANDFSKVPSVRAMTALGRVMFFDTGLSASGKLACATCHDPQYAYGPSDKRAVHLGGVSQQSSGLRAVPSLRYIQNVPPFSEHHFDEAIDESVDQGPTGGHMWDGRADTAHDQARLPLLSPLEMANSDPADIVAHVKNAPYANSMRLTYGDDVFSDDSRAFKAVLMALEVFEQSPRDFYPYDSKYDAWLRGKVQLSPAETRGLKAFSDPAKGNCSSCHPSQIQNGSFPQFTDFGFIALGVPRNAEIPANKDAAYYDLGLCGPERKDLSAHDEYCGRFRAPSLRNVSLRHSFFHNGAFHSLRRVIEFYAERDTRPEKYYPRRKDGSLDKYDDLPDADRKNVNTEAPFGGKPGGKSMLTAAEITDVLAFLSTLTDGYEIAAAGASAAPVKEGPITSAAMSPRSMSNPVNRQL
jgi:cytochrome c peroxidase